MTVLCGGKPIANKVKAARNIYGRFIGLMGRESLEEGEGLLLLKCSSIHTFFMKIPIDAVYLTKDFTVLGIETLKPWRIGTVYKRAAHVLELSEGAANLCAGEKLEIRGINFRRGRNVEYVKQRSYC